MNYRYIILSACESGFGDAFIDKFLYNTWFINKWS